MSTALGIGLAVIAAALILWALAASPTTSDGEPRAYEQFLAGLAALAAGLAAANLLSNGL